LAYWQLKRVIAHVDANIGMKLTLERMAELTHLSVFHFGRSFHNTCGSSPHQFVIRRRVEIAKGMLLSTDQSIAQIALACGLNDQAHLNRLFRSLVGVSPGVWRRHRGDAAIVPMTITSFEPHAYAGRLHSNVGHCRYG
jgi:transcriptional regulator GlxA family with amidase domain